MIKGITFDEQSMSSANMAHFAYSFLSNKSGVSKGCEITRSGNNLSVSAGYFFVHGRQVQIIGSETITAPTVQSGTQYARLVFTVNLNNTNTADSFTQGYFQVLTNADTYPALTQEDLDANGKIYQFPFAKFVINSSGISSLVDERYVFATVIDNINKITHITLNPSDWSNKEQNKSVQGMTSSSYPVWYYDGTPTIEQYEQFCYITAMETSNGSVTFKCADEVPTIQIKIVIKGL